MKLHAAILVFCCALLSSCTIWKEKRPPTWQSATGGEAFTRLLWQDIQKKNWVVVEARLAPTFVLVSPAGVMDRQKAIEALRAMDLQEHSLGDLEVRPNLNTIVVTYTALQKGTMNGQNFAETPVRAITIWQDHGQNGWLAISHAAFPVTR